METIRYAKALIELYGPAAAKFAEDRADNYHSVGDLAEELVWRKISEAIQYLIADETI